MLQYHTQNYSVIFNETVSQSLLLDVTYESRGFLHQRLAWTHNGDAIDVPRASILGQGGLCIDPVRPSDAGCYEITVIISNDLGCENAVFNLYVECKLYHAPRHFTTIIMNCAWHVHYMATLAL